MSQVLVTGGAGYIGSHMCVELLQRGYDVTVVDNLSNSSARAVQAVEQITQKSIDFLEADLRDGDRLADLFKANEFEAVLHFAGLKAVGESVAKPSVYYDNNVTGTLKLIEAMNAADVHTLVFSSSATVYGLPETMPISEDCPTNPINPYGRTKLMVEEILRDLHASDPRWRISALRYFNPVGAHACGEIGEDPNDIPNNLMPYIAQVAVGRLPQLSVFGDDYPTPDGTGVRDYIHVVDLVRGHLRALQMLGESAGFYVHNLGTGTGYSVLDMIKAFERASGKTIPYKIVGRRAGDAATSYADPSRALSDLGWKAQYGIDEMCRDTWHWQSKHPQGFSD